LLRESGSYCWRVIVERITCRHPGGAAGWPFTSPVVAQLIAGGLEFTAPVTFLSPSLYLRHILDQEQP
jgi:hypothetical protein